MKKIRRVLALFVAVSLTVTAIGCSKEVTAEDLMANVQETNVSDEYIDDAICNKYSMTAFKLLKDEYSYDNTNVVLSPLAYCYNLSMLSNAANGHTKNDLQGVLGKPYSSDYLNSLMHSFNENLNNTDNAKLYFNNALWYNSDKNITPDPDFLTMAKSFYNADAYRESFGKDAVSNINNWSSNKTDMYAERIITEIPSEAPFYVVNITQLEANWESLIRPADIFDGKFRSQSGEEQDVQMMSSIETIYLGNESVQGFMKMYSGGNYAFIALVPKNQNSSLTDLIDYVSRENVYRELIKSRKDWVVVDACIPKFSCSYTGEINSLVEKEGFGEIFSSEKANFENMGTCDEKIYCGGIAITTGLTVTESGTKKGTGANVGNDQTALNAIPVNLDCPFVFAVVETKRYLPVMVGAINSVR